MHNVQDFPANMMSHSKNTQRSFKIIVPALEMKDCIALDGV